MKRIKKECCLLLSHLPDCPNSPKPSGTKTLKEIHKIVDEIRDEIENPKPSKIEKIKTSFHFIDKEYIRKTGEFNVTLIGEIVKLENKINEIIDYLKLSH